MIAYFFLEGSANEGKPNDLGIFPCDPSSEDDKLRCKVQCIFNEFNTGYCRELDNSFFCKCFY
jgi:hypothetical protein